MSFANTSQNSLHHLSHTALRPFSHLSAKCDRRVESVRPGNQSTDPKSATLGARRKYGTKKRLSGSKQSFIPEDNENSESEAVNDAATEHSIRESASQKPAETVPTASLPHLTAESHVHMVSVGEKQDTARQAIAIATVAFGNPEVIRAIRGHAVKKGDVLSVARTAAIMGAKRTADIIPLCHPGLLLTNIEVDVEAVAPSNSNRNEARPEMPSNLAANTLEADLWLGKRRWLEEGAGLYGGVKVCAKVASYGKTGVEMEAMMAVTAGALTVYDMCKALDKNIEVGQAKIIFKAGGRSGTYLDKAWLYPSSQHAWGDDRQD